MLVLGCNKCVFEKKLQKPIFLAFQAKQTKQRIDERYTELTQNLNQVNSLEPDVLEQKIQRQVADYFSTLTRQIKDIEKDVMNHIHNSSSLAQLKVVLAALHFKLNNKDIDRLEEEKKTIDVRVDTQRYAFVAQRK